MDLMKEEFHLNERDAEIRVITSPRSKNMKAAGKPRRSSIYSGWCKFPKPPELFVRQCSFWLFQVTGFGFTVEMVQKIIYIPLLLSISPKLPSLIYHLCIRPLSHLFIFDSIILNVPPELLCPEFSW